MYKIKHSKIKNTAILFELLARQITADIIANAKNSKAITIVKEYFGDGTELKKELQLYKLLAEKKYKTEKNAENLIEACVNARKKLKNFKIKSEKYNVIRDIKENYAIDKFFDAKIDNYKLYASIYKIFADSMLTEDVNPLDVVQAKDYLLCHITNKIQKQENTENRIIGEFKKQEKDLRLLSYKILIEKFNEKYKHLGNDQKRLLREYINNVSNTNSFKEYVDKESIRVKKLLSEKIVKIHDKVLKIKLHEILNYVDNFNKGKSINDKQVELLLKYYELLKELNGAV